MGCGSSKGGTGNPSGIVGLTWQDVNSQPRLGWANACGLQPKGADLQRKRLPPVATWRETTPQLSSLSRSFTRTTWPHDGWPRRVGCIPFKTTSETKRLSGPFRHGPRDSGS